MRRITLFIAIAFAAAALAGAAARAQDVQTLSREIERLRGDLVDLQRYVYAGQGQPLSVVPPAGGDAMSADAAVRLQQIEERLRLLTGQIEELEYRQRQTDRKLDDLIARVGSGAVGAAPPAPDAGTGSGGATGGDSSGTLTGEDLAAGEAGDLAATAPGGNLPGGSEMDQYNYAFSLLRKADYDSAEVAFNEFITLHPDSDLSGNAYYWLGETYYVRGSYQDAAIAFLKGYQRFPNGDKAPDNLLKLGMTLNRLDKKAEACATFTELGSKFPDAPQTVRDKAAQEAAAAGCG